MTTKDHVGVPDDFRLDYYTLVERCPYCGAKFDEAGTTRDGKPCTHPTKMDKAFIATGGHRDPG